MPVPIRLSKKSADFFDSLQKCRYFCARKGAKVFAALAASLARQGIAGHLIQFEVGSAPSSSPLILRLLPDRYLVFTEKVLLILFFQEKDVCRWDFARFRWALFIL